MHHNNSRSCFEAQNAFILKLPVPTHAFPLPFTASVRLCAAANLMACATSAVPKQHHTKCIVMLLFATGVESVLPHDGIRFALTIGLDNKGR